jgi:light-regulated signal transduction histidine kinase (bacteriophytochrome)
MESTSTPMENHNTDKETHSLSDITLVSLTSFLQDFLQSVTINKNDKTDTQAEKQKKFIKSPKNLDLRIRHVIKRLNQFIALRKQYSSTNYQNMLRLLLKLVKQLAVQINQYHVSNTIKAKLESVIFFTKRYIAAHLQPSQALSLEEPIL